MSSDDDIIKWFDEYHRKQKAEIAEAKKNWWGDNTDDELRGSIFIYNK